MRFCCTAAMLGLLMLGPARAAVDADLAKIDAKMKTCIDEDSTDMGMKTCAGDADEAANKQLNRIYQQYVSTLKKGGPDDAKDNQEIFSRLVASERAWIAYRDKECDLRSTSMLGGTGEGLIAIDCQYTMTKDRVKQLNELMSDR